MKRQTKRRFEGPNMRSDSPHTHAIRRYIYIYIYACLCAASVRPYTNRGGNAVYLFLCEESGQKGGIMDPVEPDRCI